MARSARRPRDDDEEEDDRPRRRGDEDDQEEDTPRRRRRRDDDDLPHGTPRVYVHKRCKEETEMSADDIEKYLANPFELGEEPNTFCTGCDEYVPWTECKWTETDQNLYEYLDDMRAEMVISGDDPRPNPPALNWILLVVSAFVGGALGAGLASGMGQSKILFGAAGVALGVVVGFVWMLIDRAKFAREIEEWNRKLLKRYYKRHPEAKKRRSRYDDE